LKRHIDWQQFLNDKVCGQQLTLDCCRSFLENYIPIFHYAFMVNQFLGLGKDLGCRSNPWFPFWLDMTKHQTMHERFRHVNAASPLGY
jgi:hypothetical protein